MENKYNYDVETEDYLNNLKFIESYTNFYDVVELQADVKIGDRVIKKGRRTIRLTSLETLKSYIANGFDINSKDSEGNTELHRVCYDNLVREVKLLCAAGADVNAVNNKGIRPIDIVSSLKEFPNPCEIGGILKSYGAKEK
jgi:ankyrin repeat protein